MNQVGINQFFKSWVPDSLLIKVASHCNFDCTYCFWFRDANVKKLPPRMSELVETELISKLRNHIKKYNLRKFSVTFHGGEPLLFGKKRMIQLCKQLNAIEQELDCVIRRSIQTNGALIDLDWVKIFKDYKIVPGVSLDGPPEINDKYRVTLAKTKTSHLTERGIKLLKENDIDYGILAVCDPASDPARVLEYFVDELGISSFDVLIPDYTHDDDYPTIKDYYIKLFDLWFNKYNFLGVKIRILDDMIMAAMGRIGKTECFGYGPMTVLAVDTDGTVGPTDTLRITNSISENAEKINITKNEIDEINTNSTLQWIISESLTLSEKCLNCPLMASCGGGYLPHRWSAKSKNYRNPSIYCNDLIAIFEHIGRRIERDLRKRRSIA